MNKDRAREASRQEGNELYEVLVAEMAARRKRLNRLLRLVIQQVDRDMERQDGDGGHSRCRPVKSR
jgi:hypothetical protein